MNDEEITHIDPEDCFDIMITNPRDKDCSLQYNEEGIVFAGQGELFDESVIVSNGCNLYYQGELMQRDVATAMFHRGRII